MDGKVSILGALLVAIISGLIIRVIGDPIAERTAPQIDDLFDSVEEFWEDTGDAIRDMWKD
jgi:Flp pilus assembly pilin Flp